MAHANNNAGSDDPPPLWGLDPFRGDKWVTFIILFGGLLMLLYTYVCKPLLWWAVEAARIFYSAGALEVARIHDPWKFRIHVVFGAAAALVLTRVLWLLCVRPSLGLLVLAFFVGTLYAALTAAYYTHEQEDRDYPPSGTFE